MEQQKKDAKRSGISSSFGGPPPGSGVGGGPKMGMGSSERISSPQVRPFFFLLGLSSFDLRSLLIPDRNILRRQACPCVLKVRQAPLKYHFLAYF